MWWLASRRWATLGDTTSRNDRGHCPHGWAPPLWSRGCWIKCPLGRGCTPGCFRFRSRGTMVFVTPRGPWNLDGYTMPTHFWWYWGWFISGFTTFFSVISIRWLTPSLLLTNLHFQGRQVHCRYETPLRQQWFSVVSCCIHFLDFRCVNMSSSFQNHAPIRHSLNTQKKKKTAFMIAWPTSIELPHGSRRRDQRRSEARAAGRSERWSRAPWPSSWVPSMTAHLDPHQPPNHPRSKVSEDQSFEVMGSS